MSQHEPARRIPELLAPAGTMDAFKAALAAGADAVYCGLGQLNARRNAENLSLDDFRAACRMAHLAGSRVYLTLNVLVREDELAGALDLVRSCAAAGADAVILQDWGLVRLVRELWPSIEVHLSTQANVHDPRGVRFARERGCSRVTLSRELSLPEIEACSHEGVELEVFGHGALCVCYSGECLLSSMQRGRSANRGLCRQPCRLPYRLLDESGAEVARVEGTRLLSPRDNCTIDDLGALAAAGCGALKVEGRMKAPDYVGTVVGAYRAAIDELAAGADPSADAAVMRALARAFNRDFTDAYLHGRSDNTMMSFERGNNRGQLAGTVAAAQGGRATVALSEPVGTGDLLEIRNPRRFDDYVTVPAPRDAAAGEMLDLKLPRPMDAGCPVRVIRSEAGMAAARAFAGRTWPRKRRVAVRVEARLGAPFAVELATLPGDGHPALGGAPVRVRAEGPVVEAARTKALAADDLRDHVGRLGTSPFEAVSWDIELDEGTGLGFSTVHAVRAAAAEKLACALLAPWEGRDDELIAAPCSVKAPARRAALPARGEKPQVVALVTSPAAARAALRAGAARVYALADDLVAGACSSGLVDPSAAGDAAWPAEVVPVLGEVSRAADVERLGGAVQAGAEMCAGAVGWLALATERGARPWLWHSLPVHNHAAALELERAGAEGLWLSPELELLEIRSLAGRCRLGLGAVVSGRIRTMTCEHCVLQSMGPCAGRCADCERRTRRLTLRDEFDRASLVTSDAWGRSRLWWPQPLDATPQIPELLDCGVTRFMVDGQLLDPAEVARQVRRAADALACAQEGRVPAPRERGACSGHLFERIG
jgi:putative protease